MDSPRLRTIGPSTAWRRISWLIVAAVLVSLAWRQYAFVDHWSADVLFWDQWDFYNPLFHGTTGLSGWWASFDYQHGPHRQGVGGLLIRLLASQSHWNTRWDAYAVSFILMAAAIAGIAFAYRCGVRGLPLAVIPLIFLNPRQYQMFVGAANAAHGALPVLMLMLYGLAWFIPRQPLRLAAIILLNFLLVFTGFGLFMGLLTPLLLGLECARSLRPRALAPGKPGEGRGEGDLKRNTALSVQNHPHPDPLLAYRERGNAPLSVKGGRLGHPAMALALSLATDALFAHHYRFDPAVPGFIFPYPHPLDYLRFIGVMVANFFGLRNATAIAPGLAIAAAGGLLCAYHARRILRHGAARHPRSVILFTLSAFSLLYAANASIGRVFLGWNTGGESRYVTLMIPLMLALFIQIATASRPLLRIAGAAVFAAVLATGTLALHESDWNFIAWQYYGRLNWRAAYLRTGDQATADRLAQFQIHLESLGDRLSFLRRHQLNLFDPDGYFPTDDPTTNQ